MYVCIWVDDKCDFEPFPGSKHSHKLNKLNYLKINLNKNKSSPTFTYELGSVLRANLLYYFTGSCSRYKITLLTSRKQETNVFHFLSCHEIIASVYSKAVNIARLYCDFWIFGATMIEEARSPLLWQATNRM